MRTETPLELHTRMPERRHWFEGERLRVYPWIMLGSFAVTLTVWTVLSLPRLIDPLGNPLGHDFIAFWGAARLAVDGRPEAAYDRLAISAIEHLAVPAMGGVFAPWRYPPTYLLVIYPLGLLPYLIAFSLFLAATTGFWATLIGRMFADRGARTAAAALPAGLFNIGGGQNGFLTAGLAGFALLALNRRPVVAGILIGLLAVKPHLAVLFPLALIAAGRWPSFIAAALTTIIFAALSIAAFGWSTAEAFLPNLSNSLRDLDGQSVAWWMIPSPYVFMISLGISSGVATILQILVASVSAGCVWVAWRAEAIPFEAKAAVLAITSLLVSPFVFIYDLTWLGVGMAWLVRLGLRTGFLPGERNLLFVAAVVPLLMDPVQELTRIQIGFPMIATLLALAMRRCRVETRMSSGGPAADPPR